LERALDVSNLTGNKGQSAGILENLGQIEQDKGNLSKARSTLERAFEIDQSMGAQAGIADTQMYLALLSMDEGKPTDAEAPLRTSAEQFHVSNDSDDEALARQFLILSLLAQHKKTDAQRELQKVNVLVKGSQQVVTQLLLGITTARVMSAAGYPQQAKDSLQKVINDTLRLGYLPIQFRARLALGEIEMNSGQAAAGRLHLQALERNAKAKGFLLIARKAADAARAL
jgi:tetratricopeptide (TPR) repeat protein